MSSGMNELISSGFDNTYVTPLGVEIKDYICQTRKGSKHQLIDELSQRGYTLKDITEELDRQCACATFRYTSDDTYVGVPLGMNIWSDMVNRINHQESMIAGRIQRTGPSIKIDIYRTDFQSPPLKRKVNSLGLRPCPVMRWTKKFQKKAALKCLDYLMQVLPILPNKKEHSTVLQRIQKIINQKPKKRPWAWLVTHPVIQLELSPVRKRVIHALLSLSNGPVDWKGTPVSLHELKMYTNIPLEELQKPIDYFEEKGIIRQVYDGFTPTDHGYLLLRRAFRSRHGITFAVVHRTVNDYQVEVSTPSYVNPDIRHVLQNYGSTFPACDTPAVLSGERSQVLNVMDAVVTSLLHTPTK